MTTVAWGNVKEHSEAFVRALEEFHQKHPEDRRSFEELERDLQSAILARQVELYQELVGKSVVSG